MIDLNENATTTNQYICGYALLLEIFTEKNNLYECEGVFSPRTYRLLSCVLIDHVLE